MTQHLLHSLGLKTLRTQTYIKNVCWACYLRILASACICNQSWDVNVHEYQEAQHNMLSTLFNNSWKTSMYSYNKAWTSLESHVEWQYGIWVSHFNKSLGCNWVLTDVSILSPFESVVRFLQKQSSLLMRFEHTDNSTQEHKNKHSDVRVTD